MHYAELMQQKVLALFVAVLFALCNFLVFEMMKQFGFDTTEASEDTWIKIEKPF